MNPDRRYLIARCPAAPGTGTGANPPLASSSPRSLLTLRQWQHWKQPLQPPGTPTQLPPLTGLWGIPTGKGGSWQGAGAGTPPLLLPPQCRALTHPRQELLPPSFAPGPLQRGQRGETPNTLDLCSGLLQPRVPSPARGAAPAVTRGSVSAWGGRCRADLSSWLLLYIYIYFF